MTHEVYLGTMLLERNRWGAGKLEFTEGTGDAHEDIEVMYERALRDLALLIPVVKTTASCTGEVVSIGFVQPYSNIVISDGGF